MDFKDEDEFRQYQIAQSDVGESYESWGQVACVKDGKAAVARYSHCSCYGTWSSLTGKVTDWEGTPDELVAMAKRNADIDMPSREISGDDSDAVAMRQLYAKIIEWDKSGRPAKTYNRWGGI